MGVCAPESVSRPIVSFDMRLARLLLLTAALLSFGSSVWADATAFYGTASAPSNRTTRGFALGAGLLVVGFEFEYGDTVEDLLEGSPSLCTGMGNLLIQTPVAIFGLQPYFTTGGGVYRRASETSAARRISASTTVAASRSRSSVRYARESITGCSRYVARRSRTPCRGSTWV